MKVAQARQEVDASESDPIARWAGELPDPGRYPGHGLLLQFTDAPIESSYVQRSFLAQRHAIRLNIGFTIVFLLLFALIDPLLLQADSLLEFRMVRFGALIPLSLLALLLAVYIADARHWIAACSVCIVLFGLCWSGLLLLGGAAVLGYLSLALIQTIVGTFFLVGLPIRYSIPTVTLFTGAFIATAFAMQLPPGTVLTYTLGCVTVALICAFGAFRSERASRRQFVSQALSDAQHLRRLAIQNDRNRWLEMIAAFLRHELKNSMIGVSTSIELASRASEPHHLNEYLQRARQSLQFMRRLLAQVADATSLEVALIAQETEVVSLSDLVSDRVHDLRLTAPDWTIDARILPGLWVLGNADSLVQMLDKLIDNALEHGDPAYPLRIELRQEGQHALLTIEDRGEPLAQDVESLFQPFVSNKTHRPGTVNLGLGLFVARALASRHSGHIEAHGLDDPPGGAFVVRLPLQPAPPARPSPGQPAIAAPTLSCDTVE